MGSGGTDRTMASVVITHDWFVVCFKVAPVVEDELAEHLAVPLGSVHQTEPGGTNQPAKAVRATHGGTLNLVEANLANPPHHLVDLGNLELEPDMTRNPPTEWSVQAQPICG